MAIAVTMMPDLSKGERWFCTEQEGVAAGWRSPPAKTVKNLCPLAAMRVERLQKRYAPHTRRAVVEVRSDVGPPRSFQPLRFFHQFAAFSGWRPRWQRRTNIWREVTSPARGPKRPRGEKPYAGRGRSAEHVSNLKLTEDHLLRAIYRNKEK
jgi:hypothetical protein